MKDYKEVAESVFRKSDIIIEARQRRIRRIRTVSAAASGMCAAAIVGITVVRSNMLSHPVEDPRKGNDSSTIIYEYNITDHAAETENTTSQAATEAATEEAATEAAATEAATSVTAAETTKASLPVRVVVPENKTNNAGSSEEPHTPENDQPEPEPQEQVQPTEAPAVVQPATAAEPVDEPDDNNWDMYFDHITYRYGCNGEYEIVYDRCDSQISKDYAQKKIKTKLVDDPETGKHRSFRLTLYDIVHVSRKVAVAVRFDGDDDNYHVYFNNEYRPSDIEHMIDEMNLRGFLKVEGECTVEDKCYTDIDRAFIWYVFTSEAKLPALDEEASGNTVAEFNVSVPVFGKNDCTVRITDEGYVTTDIVSAGATFFIGRERVDEIRDYLKENYTAEEA